MNFLIRGRRAATAAAALAAISAFGQAGAQPRPAPHVGFVYPAGGQRGTTFTISIAGQNLADTSGALFNDLDLDAKIKGFDRPLTQKELNDMREQVQQLQDKRTAVQADKTKPAFTADDEKTLADLRAKLQGRAARPANPAIAETVTVEVTVAPNARPGERELRLRTPGGLSNPCIFFVSQLPEFSEPVVTVTNNPVPRNNRELDPRTNRPKTEMEITLPAVVNGQILPGEVDHFHFAAHKGQRIVVAAGARALIPYLADAVPGWFEATLALHDAKGHELAYDERYHFNPDPVLACTIPDDGNYVIEIKDAIFRGREDFVYRITVGEVPFVTGIYPLGGTAGQRVVFDVAGWNLPIDQLAMETKDKAPGRFVLSVRNQEVLSNSVRFALDTQPEVADTEPNDRPENAQAVTLPIIVNGRIDRPDDKDVFRFSGKAGEEIVAEVFARRLGSPLDSALKLTDAAGQQLAFNDDYDDKAFGLITHQADSRISFKLPADGTYFLTLTDTQHHGGADYAYRLHVGAPQPDFELRVTPASVNIRAGASAPLTVYALRRDGFAGDIALTLRNPPWGFFLNGPKIPAGQDKVQVTLTAPFGSIDEMFDLTLVGTATIGGKPVTHLAVPAEDMMQAFAYRHLVPFQEFKVAVTGRGAPFRVAAKMPVHLAPGGPTRIQIGTPALRAVGNVELELSDPPEGMTITQTTAANGGTIDVVVTCDPAKIKAGLRGNLMFNAFGRRINPANPKANAQRVPLGAVPAIPFEVDGAPEPKS